MYPGLVREHGAIFNTILRAGDALIAVAAAFMAYEMYLGGIRSWTPSYSYALALAALLVVASFPAFGLYQVWRGVTLLEEFRKISAAWVFVFAAIVAIAFLTKTGHQYSRAWLILWFAGGWLGLLLFRGGIRLTLKNLRARGFNLRHIVIVGGGDLATEILRRIRESPWAGLRVTGVFCDQPDNTELAPILGSVTELPRYANDHRVDQIWIALPLREGPSLEAVLHELRHCTADIRYVPDVFGVRLINHSTTEVAGIPVVNISVTPMDGANRWVKWFEDKVLSGLILLMISPLLIVLAMGVKLSSPGPILYRQERIGWNGRPFKILKFRTMPVDAENGSVTWGGASNKVTSKFGAFLRKNSLDELPQFFNVLRGEMSIVGPRPERPLFVEQFKDAIPEYMKKHLVKAGITGWAQINGWRGDTDLHKRIECDLFYIENWSIWMDLKIIALTLVKGFSHPAAR